MVARQVFPTSSQNRMPNNSELLTRRQVALAGGGLSGCTSVMVGRVPRKCMPMQLLAAIDAAGFVGWSVVVDSTQPPLPAYDYFYLAMDGRGRANRRIAFLNFTTAEAAEAFYEILHNRTLPGWGGEPLVVMPADLQGFVANAANWVNCGLQEREYREGKPLFFRPLPTAEEVMATSVLEKRTAVASQANNFSIKDEAYLNGIDEPLRSQHGQTFVNSVSSTASHDHSVLFDRGSAWTTFQVDGKDVTVSFISL